MQKQEIDEAIEAFMHPTVFTGVKPILLVAEELVTDENIGDVIDAVWVHWEDDALNELSYITKFAVKGKILDRSYYSPEEKAPFKGRLALPSRLNLEKMIKHRQIEKEIDELKIKRNALAEAVHKDFSDLDEHLRSNEEVLFFKKGYGEWSDPFSDIEITVPYVLEAFDGKISKDGKYRLKHPKTGVIKTYVLEEEFYAYILGSKAEVAGLQLKDESYKTKMNLLKDEAKEVLLSIEWLDLDDERLTSIKETLPRYPFEEYFKYVTKGEERQLEVPKHLLQGLELIIGEHMPKLNGPMGVQYIPIDNLLYLFHEIIPRTDALRALEVCDIVHEPSALLLGYEGQRELPPKFSISLSHVVYAYEKFPAFVEACERYLNQDQSEV